MNRLSPPGFRFSLADAVVIAVGIVATVLLRDALGQFALLLPVVLGHFFLFCNVFRMRRSFELAWAAVFIANLLAWQLAGRFSWLNALAAQTPLTVLFLALEIRSPRYHGVGSAM